MEGQGQKKGLTGIPKLITSQILKPSQDWLTGARRMLTMVIPTPKALRAEGNSFCMEGNREAEELGRAPEDWGNDETSLQKGIMFIIGSGLFNLILWGLWV